jgi:MDMPI C-terminal domain
MWAPRQAHETAIHRLDAELAAGRSPASFDAEFAADGVDELLLGFLGRAQPATKEEAVLGTIGLEAGDGPQRWSVRLLTDRIETTRGATDCELQVRATAAGLYRLLWNRPPSSDPDMTGVVDLFDTWRERVRVSW